MTLGGIRPDVRLILKDALLNGADFGIARYAALKQQIARGGCDPAIDGNGRITLAGLRQQSPNTFELAMYVLHVLHRRGENFPPGLVD